MHRQTCGHQRTGYRASSCPSPCGAQGVTPSLQTWQHRVSSQLPLPLFLFSLDSAMLFLALLLLLPKLTLPISLVVSPFFSGHIWRASCFLSRGLRFLPQRTCLGCDSLKSAQGALLNPPSLAPPTSSPQVLSLHPNSYRNLNCSQLKTQEKKCFHTCAKHLGPGEWVCVCRLPISPALPLLHPVALHSVLARVILATP